jgi:hypothetical protein
MIQYDIRQSGYKDMTCIVEDVNPSFIPWSIIYHEVILYQKTGSYLTNSKILVV